MRPAVKRATFCCQKDKSAFTSAVQVISDRAQDIIFAPVAESHLK
jgi:hypothetical protein